VTVCGAGGAGMAIAADLALKGLRVRLFELPALAAKLDQMIADGGIEVTADSETTAGKTGSARLAWIGSDARQAVAGADLVMVTVPAMYHDAFTDALAPHLTPGQTLLFCTGYWGSLRQARRLGVSTGDHTGAGPLAGVVLAESSIMPYICQPRDGGIYIGRFKRAFSVAAFPGDRSPAVYDLVSQVYSQYEPADTVLDTNVAAAGNPPIHVTLTIPVAGLYFDRYMGGRFYQDSTLPGARLVYGFDAERERLAAALGSSRFESQFDFDKRSYGYSGKDIAEALRGSPHADWFATAAYLEQVCSEDIIYALVPMVRLGEVCGVELPLTRAMIEIMGTMLERDYWAEGLSLDDLGLTGLDAAGMRRFLMSGSG
jgi:opine dehydrogenase